MNGLIIGKFYPMHNGHMDMIKFAADFMERMNQFNKNDAELYVLSYAKSTDKLLFERQHFMEVLMYQIWDIIGTTKLIVNDNLPDYPISEWDVWFWKTWKNELMSRLSSGDKYDFVFASEPYGAKLAETLGATFIPYDIDFKPAINARDIRENFIANAHHIDKSFMRFIKRKYCIMGPESSGKTTLVKSLSKRLNDNSFAIEWARPFLDFAGTNLEDGSLERKFEIIKNAQAAYQYEKLESSTGPFWIQESDLMTTKFWYEKMTGKELPNCHISYDANQHYILIDPENIPFEPDPQRYGGNERQASYQEMYAYLLDNNYTDTNVHIIKPKNKQDAIDLTLDIIHKTCNPFKD
jgi:HTH-type transcriptional regulator, transcriptional repressor of NAD biosynthesis genes